MSLDSLHILIDTNWPCYQCQNKITRRSTILPITINDRESSPKNQRTSITSINILNNTSNNSEESAVLMIKKITKDIELLKAANESFHHS
jgi:hypothetical protein